MQIKIIAKYSLVKYEKYLSKTQECRNGLMRSGILAFAVTDLLHQRELGIYSEFVFQSILLS